MPAACPIRPEVLELDPYSPGLSIAEIRDRYGLETIVKMASNENPLGVSPVVLKVVRDNAPFAFRYPRAGNPELKAAIAAHHGLDPAHIIAGNGSDEIIDLLLRVCPTPGKHNVVACKPSFSMYRIQSRLCGLEFRAVPLKADFSFDWQGLLAAVDENTALVFITTPDNPSGWCPPAREVAAFARALPAACLLVVDEAYMDFCDDQSAYSLLPDFAAFANLAILRTFSKAYGLAGLRLGYGILPLAVAGAMARAHMPFSVNILAEAAGMAALEDRVFYQSTLETVTAGREVLRRGLEDMGCVLFPSLANFIMFRLPESCPLSAAELFEALLRRGLIIRPLSAYGLPDFLRVSVGSPAENQFCLTCIKELLS